MPRTRPSHKSHYQVGKVNGHIWTFIGKGRLTNFFFTLSGFGNQSVNKRKYEFIMRRTGKRVTERVDVINPQMYLSSETNSLPPTPYFLREPSTFFNPNGTRKNVSETIASSDVSIVHVFFFF